METDFSAIYREIASALRHQYVLGIEPAHDGQFHALTVAVIGERGDRPKSQAKALAYRVQSREGYLAPAP